MKSDTKVSIKQWSNTVLKRVANLPAPYRWNFEIWLQQQLGIGHLDSVALVKALEGLDDTRQEVQKVLEEEEYPGKVYNLTDVEDVVEFALQCSEKYPHVFIGGNGQRKIIEITQCLKEALAAK